MLLLAVSRHSCLILSWSLCFSAYLFLNHSFSPIYWNDGISNPPLFLGRVSTSPIHALLGIFIHLLTCLLQSASRFNLVQVACIISIQKTFENGCIVSRFLVWFAV